MTPLVDGLLSVATLVAGTPAQVSLPTFGLDAGVRAALLQLAGFTLAALAVTTGTALAYRWFTRDRIQLGLSILLGVATVGIYLNTVGLLNSVITDGAGGIFEPRVVLFNVVALGIAMLVSPVGRSGGDRLATDLFAVSGAKQIDAEVSRIVRTVGRVTSVELPAEIEDMEGYDPVSPAVKESLAGKTLLFPRRLSVADLRQRLVTRLADDYGVGHADLDLDADGTVSYLAVGSRAAGLGPTLSAGAVAVAVRADPPAAASVGDVVQVWTTDPEPTRLATGELRATTADTATLVVDEADAPALDASTEYRIVTLPAEPQADREFAGLLRAADETMGVVTVAAGSGLIDATVADLHVSVAAIRPAGGTVEAIPGRTRSLAAGDTVYVIARPDLLRKLEGQATEVTVVGSTD